MKAVASSVSSETPTVTADDQSKINRFAILHRKSEELAAEERRINNELQNLSDAADELLLLDDDQEAILTKIGDVFVAAGAEQVTVRIEKLKGNAEQSLQTTKQQQGKVQKEMSELKAQLYGKFGNNINLEASDTD